MQTLFIYGPPGSGKTTLGKLLAGLAAAADEKAGQEADDRRAGERRDRVGGTALGAFGRANQDCIHSSTFFLLLFV